ncbi:Sec-independent protein translocase subunit TatA [Sanguibacter gelidistatuariae]|nr:Sec-independent protein translocase subunit TatA [Sanguibacter gelidistatuariae]
MKPIHWVVLLVIVLLLFGAKRLPDLAKSVGQSMKIFKKEIKELQEDDAPVSAAPVAPVAPVVVPVVVPEAVAHPVDTSKPATAASESTNPPKA